MHRATLLADDGRPRRERTFSPFAAVVLPWRWARMFEGHARREAARQGCAFVHFGVECVIHLPEGSYGTPWRDVHAERDGPSWRIQAAGLVVSLVDVPLAAWERRRLQSSTRDTSP